MKRKNCEFCGADYELSLPECPFCGAANVDYQVHKVEFSDEKRNPRDLRCPYCNQLDRVYKFDSFEKIQFNPIIQPVKQKAPVITDIYVYLVLGGLGLIFWIFSGRSGSLWILLLSLFLLGYGIRATFVYNKFDQDKEDEEFKNKAETYNELIRVRKVVTEKMHHLYTCGRDEHIFFPGTPDSATYRNLQEYLAKYVDREVG